MNKGTWTAVGFILFILGMSALILSLVGVRFSFLSFIDKGGALLGFVIKLLMALSGIIIAVLAQTNWKEGE